MKISRTAKTAALLATTFLYGHSSFGGHHKRCTPADFGATGTGAGNDAPAINAAALACNIVDFEGKTYRVTSRLDIQTNNTWMDGTIDSAIPANRSENAIIRGLFSENISLLRMTVNRGSDQEFATVVGEDPFHAGLRTSAVLCKYCKGVWYENVEVTGNGVGTGIRFENSAKIFIVNPYVHDMLWSYARTGIIPPNETIVGIWSAVSSEVSIINPRVMRLTPPAVQNGSLRHNSADGIASSGTKGLYIKGGEVTGVGEGFDAAGSSRTENLTIDGVHFHDNDAVGIKVGHAYNVVLTNNLIERVGLWGITLFSYGPSLGLATSPTVRRAYVANNTILNVGSNMTRPANAQIGIVLDTNEGVGPAEVRLENNAITDNQSPHTMDRCASQAMVGSEKVTITGTTCWGFLDEGIYNFP